MPKVTDEELGKRIDALLKKADYYDESGYHAVMTHCVKVLTEIHNVAMVQLLGYELVANLMTDAELKSGRDFDAEFEQRMKQAVAAASPPHPSH
jgi:hypothetical protein